MESKAVSDCLTLWGDVVTSDSGVEPEGTNLDRILIIVSEAALRGQIVPALRRASFAVIAVSSSRQGWNALFEKSPDLIIMAEDSAPLASRIRQVSSVPIIVLGSNGNRLALVRALVSGADCYMTMPLNLDELVLRTRALLRRSKKPSAGETQSSLS